MKQLLSKRWTIRFLILLLLLVSAACQAAPDSPPAPTQAPEAEVTAAPEIAAQETVSVQADVVFGPGPFNFPETTAGLADLSSYKGTLILSFTGTRDAQPSQWSKTYIMLSTKEPAARQLTIERTGDLSKVTAIFLAEFDGAAYEVRGQNGCVTTMIEEGNSLSQRLEPAGFLN